ncbi:MAG: hypothetical protein QOG42_1483 [Solirubrobacteraceae bacterium]|nr:hypothetical protein [Solirubrobacteraceae bacterium]
MIAGGRALLLWALYLAILWVALWAFGVPDVETVGLLGAAATLCAATGAWTLWRGRRRGVAPHGDDDARLEPDLSVASAWTAVALATLMVSLVFGPWLGLIGAAMLAFGIGGLIRERRAVRRAERREPV